MLTITNHPDGRIAGTNYWESGYNAHDLAYLSGHNNGLRLLLPTRAGEEWLTEIKTGRRALIRPPVRPGYTNHIDIVFDDGTDTPFSLCIDRKKQVDRALRSGNTRLIVYAGHLGNALELPCAINLPDAPKQEYLSHVTVSTGHISRCYRHDLPNDVVATVSGWLSEMMDGESRAIYTDRYAVRCDWHNAKAAGFNVSRLDGMMQSTDIVRITVCRHSKRARLAWEFVGGKGQPPAVPFVAAGIITDNVIPEDLPHIGMIADFERYLAWAWMESQT